MPQKIDGLSYPKTAIELLGNRELLRLVLQTYTSPQIRRRITCLAKPPKPSAVYVDYIAPNAPNALDLPNHIKAMATDLIKSNDHDLKLWKGVRDLVVQDCKNFLDRKIIPDFFDEKNCDSFSTYHRTKLLAVAEKKFGKTRDVMLRLNLTEEPAVSALLVEMLRRDLTAAMEFAKYAVTKAKLKVDPAEVLNAVKTGRGLTETGSFKVDAKKLKLCGFDKPDAKVRNRVEDMVNAYMSGDKPTAKKIFELIQKSEPKNSFVRQDTIESLFKAFKKFKVVIG